jgi:hypothetical protein
MAILNLTGFEVGDSQEFTTTSGTFSIQSTTKRSGGYALQVNPTTTAVGYVEFRNTASFTSGTADTGYNVANLWISFYFRYGTKPAANSEAIIESRNSAPATKAELRLNSAGNLEFYDSAGVIVGSAGATTLAQDTWYLIDVRFGTGSPSGTFSVQVNGAVELSGTCDQTATNINTVRLGKGTNRNGQTVNFYYDDGIVDTAAFVGTLTGKVLAMFPKTGTATYSAWTAGTGTGFGEVDEAPPDGATSYWQSVAQNDAHSTLMQSTTTAGISGTLAGVKQFMSVIRVASGPTIRGRIRNGATDVDSADLVPGAAYTGRQNIVETDPNGAIAWTTGGLDTVELGILDNDAGTRSRCSALSLHVYFTPAAGGSFQAAWARGSNVVLTPGKQPS